MLDFAGDADHPVDAPGPDATAARPDAWVPAPGVVAAGAAAPVPETLSFTYTVTLQDLVASVLDHPATRKQYEALLSKAGWRRGLPMLALTLVLVLLTNIFMFELDLAWSVLSTAALAGLFAVVQWSQIDHSIKRRLPAALEEQARHELAQHGVQRRVVAEPAGLTLLDAAGAGHFGWHQVQLTETDRYVIVTALHTRWAIPQTLGQPLASFVEFARSQQSHP
ncbi:MAG: hypothetical protein ACOH1Y_01430 [Propionicimonas sp.]